LLEVDEVALAVDRLALLVEGLLAARRRVVPARRRALDDEPLDGASGLLLQHAGERVRRDDRQEVGAAQRRVALGAVVPRVEDEALARVAELGDLLGD